MREIKFRAWHKPASKMYTQSLESINLETKTLGIYTVNDGYQHLRLSDFELMQYTGVRDKNGNEIYEGDILETKHKMKGESWLLRYRVFFNEKGYWDAKSIDEEKPYSMCYNGFHRCKKIGNIYENPELLEEK